MYAYMLLEPFALPPARLPCCALLCCSACCRGSGDILAVGDATGRIVFWHGARDALQRRPQHDGSSSAAGGAADAAGAAMQPQPEPAEGPKLSQATVHWHAEAVCCLAFSPDDAYLLSGGHEGVLVVWDISSGRRTYLPRLGELPPLLLPPMLTAHSCCWLIVLLACCT